jgi:hypothetical protein
MEPKAIAHELDVSIGAVLIFDQEGLSGPIVE